MEEKRIEIIEDIDGKIVYDEIARKDLNRADVEAAKAEIERIEAENADYLARVDANRARIEEIKAQIAEAERIIAIADDKKAAELAELETPEEVSEQGDQIVEEQPVEAPQM